MSSPKPYDFSDWSDHQLVAASIPGTAQAELTRRFMNATKESSPRLEDMTKWLVRLTVAITVLTLVLVALTILLLVGE